MAVCQSKAIKYLRRLIDLCAAFKRGGGEQFRLYTLFIHHSLTARSALTLLTLATSPSPDHVPTAKLIPLGTHMQHITISFFSDIDKNRALFHIPISGLRE